MSTNTWDKIVSAANAVNTDPNALANCSTSDPKGLIAQSQSIFGGGLFGSSAGQVTLGGGLTTQQLTSILQAFQALTPEEKAELEQLKKDHQQSVKLAKLSEFKKLPSDLRQFIVNIIYWKEAKDKIEQTSVDKPDRLKELEQKESNSNMSQYMGGISGVSAVFHSNMGFDLLSLLPIPAGVTAEQLKEAHVEATLEETMLDE